MSDITVGSVRFGPGNTGDIVREYPIGEAYRIQEAVVKAIRSPEAEAYWRGVIADELDKKDESNELIGWPTAAAFVRGKTQEVKP